MSNLLDSIVGFISPRAGFERVRARVALEELEKFSIRNYEAASKGRRLKYWLTGANGPNRENEVAIAGIRDRARDLVRNNPYASRGLQVITSNVIGEGIIPTAQLSTSLKDTASERKRVANADRIWSLWAETTLCDYDEKLDIYGLQNLILRTIVQDGECLVRKIFDKDNPSKIPLRLKVMEADYIDTKKSGKSKAGGSIVNGVEYSKDGKKVGYWLFGAHPGEVDYSGKKNESSLVPVSEVIHPFRIDRAQQNRGVSWFASVIIRLRGLDEYEDFQMVKQKVSACFAAFVSKNEDMETEETEVTDKIEPGMVSRLAPGEEITFASPPSVDGFRDFVTVGLRAVAVGLGITPEAMTGDLSNTSFSSGRLGWLEFYRNIRQWRTDLLLPQVLNPIWKWFTEAATIGSENIDGVAVTWTPPKREMIDPVKEIAGMREKVRAGFSTVSEEIRTLGYDPTAVFTERAAELKQLDDLGIYTSSDPRKDKGIVDTSEGDSKE